MRGTFAAKPAPPLGKAIIICLLASVFYFYEFTLQVSPSVMTTQLMTSFNVGAVGLGTLSAFYFYAYAPMQLPAGILYDRFGPRTLLPIATLICAVGALFFSATHSSIMASYGRFLMGIGSAFAFIGTIVLISRWFKPQYFAVLAGVAQLMSSFGAMFGEVPLAKSISAFGWRHSMIGLAVVGLVLAVAMRFIIRDYPKGHEVISSGKRRSKQSMKGLSKVLKSKQTWFVAGYAFCSWAPIAVFAALWGVPFIKALYPQVSTAVASSAISMVWLGIAFGSPFAGWLSELLQNRCGLLTVLAIIGIISTMVIVFVPVAFPVMYVALFGLGLAAGGQTMSFAVLKDVTAPKYVGTAVGFNNMAVVAGGAIFQPLVGYLLHLFWNGGMQSGAPYYTVHAYQMSLWILPLCYIGGVILSWYFIKETNCRPNYETKPGQITQDEPIIAH